MYKRILNNKNKRSYSYLPKENFSEGTFIGRVFNPKVQGPSVVTINKSNFNRKYLNSLKGGQVFDLSYKEGIPTISHLLRNSNSNVSALVQEQLSRIEQSKTLQKEQNLGHIEEIMENSLKEKNEKINLLSPVDLQSIKAAGVTFITSLLERLEKKKKLFLIKF